MNIFISIIISTIFSIPMIYNLIKQNKKDETISIKCIFKNNIFEILAIIIIIIGVFIRIVDIDKVPTGLNQDEVSSAYEAFSILKYGIDRNNNSFPVHLVAWGSGQNALYTYLIIPFLVIFKNTILTIRLPMALVSSFSLIIMYFITNKEFDKKRALIYVFIFSILPWHILKSRWGLESNLFPELIMYAVFFLYFGIKNNKMKYKILSGIVFGISTYSYGTSYFFVPIMLFFILVNCLIIKKIKLKDVILIFAITGIIAFPMILFVIINFFDLNTITIFNITIPKLSVVRFKEITSLNNQGISILNNLKQGLRVLWNQRDDTALNFADNAGILYTKYISWIFIILGLGNSIVKHKKSLIDLIMNYWCLVSIFLIAMVEPNINRINSIFIPLSYYLAKGIIFSYDLLRAIILKYNKKINSVILSKISYIFISIIIIMYVIEFGLFVDECFSEYQEKSQRSLTYKLDETFKRVNEINKDKKKNIYITLYINQPYIFWLWHNEISVYDFLSDSEILYKDTMFHYVSRIGNTYFGLPEKLDEEQIYIMDVRDLENYNVDNFTLEKYDKFIIVYK